MADAQPNAPAKSSGKALFFAVAGLNVVAGLVGLFLIYKSTLGFQYSATTEAEVQAQTPESAAHADQPVLYSMEPFTVNLGGTPQRMIRIEISLEMLDQDGFEEVMGLGARSRDAIVKLLNEKTFPEIESLQGKLFLKDQIALALNSTMKRGVVKDVFFTDFVVQ